jgi:hypothetical protein
VSKKLLEEEKQARQKLADAERIVRVSAPTSPPPPAKSPSDANFLGLSVVGGPPAAPERAVPVKPEPAAPNTVVISLPGVTRPQVNSELLRLFANLADEQPGQASPIWSGDLLAIHVRPVADPAKFATRIRFGRVLYYSRNDRAMTVQLSAEQSAQLQDPARDPLTALIGRLNQRADQKKLLEALEKLRGMKVLDRQAEIAAAVEAVAAQTDLDQNVRETAVRLVPAWSGQDGMKLLERLLDDRSVVITWAALDALSELKAVAAAGAIAQKWSRIEPSRVSRALVALGSGVEKVVLPYLQNTNNNTIKVEACRVLQEVGTEQSLKPLLDVINDKEQAQPVIDAAKEAMKHILDRK